MTLTAIQGSVQMFRGDGFLYEYPTQESRPSSAGFGYASDMLHLAVNKDDPVAFMFFVEAAGGVDCEVLIAGNLINYAACHGATECVSALFAAGAKSEYGIKHYLALCDAPPYGPRAVRPFQA